MGKNYRLVYRIDWALSHKTSMLMNSEISELNYKSSVLII